VPAGEPVGGQDDIVPGALGKPVGEPTPGHGRPRDHREVGQAEERPGFVPAVELAESVEADHEDRQLRRQPRLKRAQSVQRVGGPAALDLEGVDREARVARDGGAHPGQALLGGGDRAAPAPGLVGRLGTRHEDHALEVERLGDRLGRPQVPDVVVSSSSPIGP